MGKPPWKSKTIGVNFFVIMAVWSLARLSPDFHTAMCGNIDGMISLLAAVNILLRYITTEPIT